MNKQCTAIFQNIEFLYLERNISHQRIFAYFITLLLLLFILLLLLLLFFLLLRRDNKTTALALVDAWLTS